MSSPQFFLVEEDENDSSKFKILPKHTSEHPDHGLPGIAPQCRPDSEMQPGNKDKKLFKEEKCAETSVSSTETEKPSLGRSEVADNDDGFRTPTSSDHKIPIIAECPPAPKKTRPNPSAKRKVSPSIRRRNLPLDLSSEVELMFPPTLQDDIGRRIKRARTHNSD